MDHVQAREISFSWHYVLNIHCGPKCLILYCTVLCSMYCNKYFQLLFFSINRRGSNVSLTLDMSTLGNVETCSIAPTPREKIFLEYLQTASHVLTRMQLKEIVASAHSFQAEFMV